MKWFSLACVGTIVFLFISWPSLPVLFSRNGVPVRDVFVFASHAIPQPRSVLPVQGNGFGLIQANGYPKIQVMGKPEGRLVIPIPKGPRAFTTLQIGAIAMEGEQSLWLENTSGPSRQLSNEPVLINYKLNLTPYLNPNTVQQLVLSVQAQAYPAVSHVERLIVLQSPAVPSFPRVDLLLIGLFMIILLLHRPRRASWKLVLIPVALGLMLRWNELAASAFAGLDFSDAESYRAIALAFNPMHPFATSFREPFIIWTHYVTMFLLGPAEIHIRLHSLLFSTATIAATYGLAWTLSRRPWVAWIAAMMVACNHLLVYTAPLGGRNDLYMLLMVLFCTALVIAKRSAYWEIGLGLGAGVMALTWLVGLPAAYLAYGWRWIAYRLPFRQAFLFFTAAFMLTLPHLVFQWKTYRDPLHSLNFTTDYYRELRENDTSGSGKASTSWTDYLWARIGPGKLLGETTKGYAAVLFNPEEKYNKILLGFHYTTPYNYFLFPFLLFGMWIDLRRAKGAGLFFMVAFLNIGMAFIQVTPHPRLFMHAAAFFAYFCGWGMAAAMQIFRQRVGRRFLGVSPVS